VKNRHLLVLGNSAAALTAVRVYRAHGGAARVTMVSAEACPAYSPVLTTYYLREKIGEEALYLCTPADYRGLDVDCRLGVAAVELDAEAQSVVCSDGSTERYDQLLIATGARPRHIDGDLDPEAAADVCYLRTLADARRIRERAAGAGHVVVLGAGLVSLQVATALARLQRRVTCVVSSHQILSQNVDAEAAALLRAHIERSANIGFVFGADVTGLGRAGAGCRVTLGSGEELAADLVVAGKGITPNLGFVDRGQLRVDRGIVVGRAMRTSRPGVYAAGDVAECRNRVTRRREPVTNWIDACEQGRIAGANLAGHEVTTPGSVAENVTTLFGLSVASIGVTRPDETAELTELTYRNEALGWYRKLFVRDERVVGAVLLGNVSDAGVMRSVIAGGTQVGETPEGLLRRPARYADAVRHATRAFQTAG
jgi:NAD(P)H-nitrite reductase large subunit